MLQEENMDEGGGEMRFSLPAAPSPGPLLFLLAACRELARAGGHTTGALAVQLLEWELSNAVLQAFRWGGGVCVPVSVWVCLSVPVRLSVCLCVCRSLCLCAGVCACSLDACDSVCCADAC